MRKCTLGVLGIEILPGGEGQSKLSFPPISQLDTFKTLLLFKEQEEFLKFFQR